MKLINDYPTAYCICPTYNRATGNIKLIEMAVASFLAQDYPNKQLIILNDTPGQLLSCNLSMGVGNPEQIDIVNSSSRIDTLGLKMHWLTNLVREYDELNSYDGFILPWDDDDVSLPQRIKVAYHKLYGSGGSSYYNPRMSLYLPGQGGMRWCGENNVFHNASAYKVEVLENVKYDQNSYSDYDQKFDKQASEVCHTASSAMRGGMYNEVQYIYRFGHYSSDIGNISGNSDVKEAYKRNGEKGIYQGRFNIAPSDATYMQYLKFCVQANQLFAEKQ